MHLDGYDQIPVITATGPGNRKEYLYFTETTFYGIRFGEWKFLFTDQDKWFNGVQSKLVSPLITGLDLDPFERFHKARGFDEWQENRSGALTPAMGAVQQFFNSFKQYPPHQISFDMDTSEIVDEMVRNAPQ